MRTSSIVAAAVLLLLTGCTAQGPDTSAPTTSSVVRPSPDPTGTPVAETPADAPVAPDAPDAPAPDPTGPDAEPAGPVPSPPAGAPSPQPDHGWPAPVPEEVAIRGEVPVTVVWVAVDAGPLAGDLDAASDRVREVGYTAPHTPLTCRAAAQEALGVPGGVVGADRLVCGVPLYFATTADAQALVERFRDVAAVVAGDVFCHFT